MIRLIASDIDETLLPYGETAIRAEVFEEIHRLERKGILFCPASGRQYTSMRRLFAPVADKAPFLCENGAVVFGPGSPGPVLGKTVMGQEQAVALCRDIVSTPGLEVLISGVDTSYLCPKGEEILPVMRGKGNNVVILSRPEEVPEDIVKLAAFCPAGTAESGTASGPQVGRGVSRRRGGGRMAGLYPGGKGDGADQAVRRAGHWPGRGDGLWGQFQRRVHAVHRGPTLADGERRPGAERALPQPLPPGGGCAAHPVT